MKLTLYSNDDCVTLTTRDDTVAVRTFRTRRVTKDATLRRLRARPNVFPMTSSRREPLVYDRVLTRWLFGVSMGAALMGCGDSQQSAPSPSSASEPTSETSGEPTGDDPSGVPPAPSVSEPAPKRCSPAPGTTGAPRTMTDVVELINGLPMPVTLPCFLESLERPLRLYATSSVVSAQPANGYDNPRLFIINDHLSLSVVPFGDASNLLEIGEFTTMSRSVKGELAFPVTEPIPLEAPLTKILANEEGTICRICHFPETAMPSYPLAGAFESIAYRPIPRLEVNFDYVVYQYEICDHEAEPERCAFYAALFDQGQVTRGEFSLELPTFE